MAGLIGADEAQVSVLADQAADVGVVGLDLGILCRCIPGRPCPVDCFGYGVTTTPLRGFLLARIIKLAASSTVLTGQAKSRSP